MKSLFGFAECNSFEQSIKNLQFKELNEKMRHKKQYRWIAMLCIIFTCICGFSQAIYAKNDDITQTTDQTIDQSREEGPYQLTYHLDGGTNHPDNPSCYEKTTEEITLLEPTREGCVFDGWYLEKALENKITSIRGEFQRDLDLYAKWTPIEYKIDYVLNGGKNNSANPTTYNVTTKTFTLKPATKKNYYFAGWYTDAEKKTKVTQVKKGTQGNLTFYAKWIREYTATSTSATITKFAATKKNTVKLEATVSKRLQSDDVYYYLVALNPQSGNPSKRIQRVEKKTGKTEIKFTFDTSKDRVYAISKFAIGIKKAGKTFLISKPTSFISNPQKLAPYQAAYKKGATKKGLQTGEISQIRETNSKNLFLNLYASTVLSEADIDPVFYTYNGTTYKFGAVRAYRNAITEACSMGVNVTLQICLNEATFNYDEKLIAPQARQRGHLYYTWNTFERDSREKMEAIFCYLAEAFSGPDCYVSNWILGNEVNADKIWNYKGSMSKNSYIKSYTTSYRTLYNAVRSTRANSRVFICLDNMWNRPDKYKQSLNGKEFLTGFVREINRMQSGVKWNLAFHPLSVRLTYPNFWNPDSYYKDKDLVNKTENTEFITMKNLSVLTKYVSKKYGSSRRIILSENDFDVSQGTIIQAASLAYAYNIAACNSMIDAFHIRSYYDEAGDDGFRFGIKGRDAYGVFCHMDTKDAGKATNGYLPIWGAKSWKKLIKNYSISRITHNR